MDNQSNPKFRSPTDVELAFLHVITRDYPAASKQVENCLISNWIDGPADIRVLGGPPLIVNDRPVLGPCIKVDDPEVVAFAAQFWLDEFAKLMTVEVFSYGSHTRDEFMSLFVDAALTKSDAISYPPPTT